MGSETVLLRSPRLYNTRLVRCFVQQDTRSPHEASQSLPSRAFTTQDTRRPKVSARSTASWSRRLFYASPAFTASGSLTSTCTTATERTTSSVAWVHGHG